MGILLLVGVLTGAILMEAYLAVVKIYQIVAPNVTSVYMLWAGWQSAWQISVIFTRYLYSLHVSCTKLLSRQQVSWGTGSREASDGWKLMGQSITYSLLFCQIPTELTRLWIILLYYFLTGNRSSKLLGFLPVLTIISLTYKVSLFSFVQAHMRI